MNMMTKQQQIIHYAIEILIDEVTDQVCGREDWKKPNHCTGYCDRDCRYYCWLNYLTQKIERTKWAAQKED